MKRKMQSGLRAGWLTVAGACALTVSQWAAAQRPTIPVVQAPDVAALPQNPEVEALDELDEVQIQGGRIYERIVRAEDKFFKLFNELNKDDDYDINCAFVPVDSDSRIEQRFCMPAFFADAKAEQVRLSQYCASLVAKDEEGNITGQGPCYEPVSAEVLFAARREEYLTTVLKTIAGDPGLKDMYNTVENLHKERAQLSRQFDDLKAQQVSNSAQKNRTRSSTRQ
jgi:hypothetical protein